MDSSMGKMCLGKDVIEISSDRNEGSGDWDSPEYKDTAGSGGKKEPEALVFHKMDTEEDSDRYIAQCFVNGLYASDGEINLEKNDNLISNDYAVKLCLEYEVRKGKKLVKKELMVLLRGEIYFVQFIINPEEDEFEPGLIFRRSFLRSTNAIKRRETNLDDRESCLDFDIDEVPQTETDLPPMLLQKIGCGDEIDQMLKISLKEAQSDEEIFFSVTWVRAFNIREPVYPELCREFYATYEFDEVCADDERLGLYHAEELNEEGFDAYFQGGWSSEWFISKIARKSKVLTEETIRSLSTPVYYRDLDRTTLRELIGSEDRFIPEILVDDVPRVAVQRALRVQRASMQDLYERIGSMEIRQEAIERMEYRHAYHWDRISGLKGPETSMSSLKEDTLSNQVHENKMYEVFKGQSSSAPSGCVTLTLALTHIPAIVERENATNTTTEDPLSHTEGETDANKQEILMNLSTQQIEGKGIATNEQARDQRKLVKASSIVRPDPDAPVLAPYTINNKLHYLTDKQIQEYLDKEEKIRKAEEEARLFAITKLEVIKDAKHAVLMRQHTEKVRKSLKLRKHKYDNYMWTVSSRLKLEPITDIKIHPKTKLVVITVYKGIDGRNFDVHKLFAFGDFGISELDELREIIPKKKNTVVKDLMNSLARRYERKRKIPKELGIKSSLPAPVPTPEQASSKSLRKKRKHMELEPEIRIPGMECNRAFPENVPFVNNMVIEEPKYGIFFTDEFGDQAFQRWSVITPKLYMFSMALF
ncbi:hypothetical protein Tco_0689960, partial [Tanacetum coccineum]